MDEPEKLFSTAEIMLATGLGRGTITNRAKTLGFERTGFGYTESQIVKIISLPLESHRKSEQEALELRERLNKRIAEEGLPMAFVTKANGKTRLEYHAK